MKGWSLVSTPPPNLIRPSRAVLEGPSAFYKGQKMETLDSIKKAKHQCTSNKIYNTDFHSLLSNSKNISETNGQHFQGVFNKEDDLEQVEV